MTTWPFPPRLGVNGQLHGIVSRQAKNCWFIVDSEFDKYYKKLTKKELTFAFAFREILRTYNSRLFTSIRTLEHDGDIGLYPFQNLSHVAHAMQTSLHVCAS